MAPAREQAGLSRDQLWSRIQQDLHAFIGQTAFEDLARAWLLAQGRAKGWSVTYACFAPGGFTDAARQFIDAHHGSVWIWRRSIAICPKHGRHNTVLSRAVFRISICAESAA